MRIIFLLAPVFVSFFWAIALSIDKKKCSTPRLFLSKFMFLAGLIFIGHFLYFASYPDLFFYINVFLQWISLIIFPLYHIYFRLLTVDEKFSLKVHFWYLAIPSIIGLIYTVGVMFIPVEAYKAFLLNPNNISPAASVRFLVNMRTVLHLSYVLSVILSLFGNLRLIGKYGHKAELFYSDVQDAEMKNAKNINYVIIVLSIISIVASTIGRYTIMVKMDWFIYIAWPLFAVLLFLMGSSGIRQKMINPAFENSQSDENSEEPVETYTGGSQVLLNKIMHEFTTNKIYINSNLNINDLVKIVGVNRSYISAVINKQSNQNFCTFVNGFRIDEMQRVLLENRKLNLEELAHCCGFGSVNSMKRALYTRLGLSITEYKNQIKTSSRANSVE
jgi:AraC-like DNA-binding protein